MSEFSVLVVDDQAGIRLLLTDVLENEGYHVQEATTGKEALEKIHNVHFDMMILDYKLPIVDGAEVLQKMEKENIELPSIVMSGLAESISLELERYQNVKKILAKPFNVHEVLEEVKAICHS
ncbi:response regulator [Oceanobacillus senegalensis]|uniref:response regulator n=1 Tax=Oceanobacillus senegalensis TaxID=1936063 RepID=UPI000A30BB02|nr:response regulator [Oceanobacillus senegalensis]